MHFIVTGRDHPDSAQRRLDQREAHLAYIKTLHAEGRVLHGTAIVNDDGEMKGSVIVYDVDSREALDALLAQEPYVTGNVWGPLEITRGQVGPAFLHQKT